MPITAADIKLRLSGGAGNTDPNASLGGAISTTELVDSTLHNLFDAVSSAEAASGDTEYRCIYVQNAHGTLEWQAVVAWISAQSTVPVAIGLDPAGVNGTATTIANESTAPAGVAFSSPTTEGSGLALGNIPAGQHYAVWVRRTVPAAQAALSGDTATLTFKGDTAG